MIEYFFLCYFGNFLLLIIIMIIIILIILNIIIKNNLKFVGFFILSDKFYVYIIKMKY